MLAFIAAPAQIALSLPLGTTAARRPLSDDADVLELGDRNRKWS